LRSAVFKNPVTVRSNPVRRVVPDGSWEAQVVCDIDDFGEVRKRLVPLSSGRVSVRIAGDVIEMIDTCNSQTEAEHVISQWKDELK
jgi:hypothetical protein